MEDFSSRRSSDSSSCGKSSEDSPSHESSDSPASIVVPRPTPSPGTLATKKRGNKKRRKKRIGEWSEEEHAQFLLGAEALGGDDWQGISKNFVKSRSARQVKCHALTYARTEDWNIDEHSRFLKGVKIAGRGEFTYIAKHFVKTRNAREVQEYADNVFGGEESEDKKGKRRRKLSLYCYRKYAGGTQAPEAAQA